MNIEPVISNGDLIAMFVTFLVTFVLPIVLGIVLIRRYKGITKYILIGGLGFYIPQMVVRIPLLQILSTTEWFKAFATDNTLLYGLTLGFTAALFETIGRLVVFAMLRKDLNYKFGLGAGFGHGAMEAILLVGVTYINNIVFAILLNVQGAEGLSTILGSKETADYIIESFQQATTGLYLVAGLERLLTMVVHVAFSLIICYGFVNKKLLPCTLVVLGAHTTLDMLTAVLASSGASALLIEFVVLVFAILALAVIFKLKLLFHNTKDICE